jgi:hypothetical protein
MEMTKGNAEVASVIERGVKDGLGQVGDSVSQATLYFIKMKSGLEMDGIPSQPDTFCAALRGIYGTGAAVILKAVAESVKLAASDIRSSERPCVSAFLKSIEENIQSIESGTC